MSHTTKKIIGTIALAISALTSNTAFAQDKQAGTGPNPYADCGIGAALFSDTKWAAVVSNVTWDLGTTALISGTMSPNTCSGKQVKVALFIRDTQAQLAEEAAVGSGEHLTAVLNLSECSSTHHAQAIGAIRASMAKSIAAPGYSAQTGIQKSTSLYKAVDAAVTNSCAA
jgi:hypothetical protein